MTDLLENGQCNAPIQSTGDLNVDFLVDNVIECAVETGTNSSAGIKVALTLLSNPQKDFMTIVNADIRRLDLSAVTSGVSEQLDTTSTLLQDGAVATGFLDPCIPLLGQTLQGIVKLMDGIADVSTAYGRIEFCTAHFF